MRTNPRVLLFAAIIIGSALPACSGSFGAGSTVPQGAGLPSGPFVPASPSPTPNSATGILTYGRNAVTQPLPSVGGYGGQISFSTPAPRSSGPPPDDVSIGVTTSVVKPEAAPDLNLESGKGKHAKRRKNPARALFYITLLPTHDAVLESTPRIAVDIPREIAAAYKDGDFGIALYSEAEKNSAFRLAAAEREGSATAAPSATATATVAATASAVASPSPPPSGPASARPPNAPGTVAPSAAPTLPPQRITFAPTATQLKLVANRAVVFAVYALPPKNATPKPEGSASAAPSHGASPAPSSAGAASASGSPVAAASPASSVSPEIAASGSAAIVPAAPASPASSAPASTSPLPK